MRKLILLALMLVAVGSAQAQDELYIYQHSGATDTLRMSDVKRISHSRIDLKGERQSDCVVMAVQLTNDNERQYLLAELDSVVMLRGDVRVHLTRFTGGMTTNGNSSQKAPRRTSLDGDFMAKTADVDFFWEEGDHLYLEDGRRDTLVNISESKATADFFFGGDKLTAETITVYYAGQSPLAYNQVVVAKDQTQQTAADTRHIGVAGDCGTAMAVRQEDESYRFNLEHKAAYLCFLPYIANDLGRTVLKKITVHSGGGIAGTFTLSPDDGLTPNGESLHTITLTTGDFILPQRAAQSTSAYMVLAPQSGSTRLTCEFTVYDTELQSTGVYTKTIDLKDGVAANMVYVVKANCNNYVVDMGLPVKFLNHNYGATAPEEYGGYYAFGEIEDKGVYNNDASYVHYNTAAKDIMNIRMTEYDVAHVRLGGNFSMPTAAELRMLTDSCTWTWTNLNGINGQKVTGKNGNTLFLPAAGYRSGSGNNEITSRGCYRSSNLKGNSDKVNWYLNLKNGTHSVELSNKDIYYGESIRPVISTGVQMTDGTLVQVQTDSVQWKAGELSAKLFGYACGVSKSKTAVELGFVVGNTPAVTKETGTVVTSAASADGVYNATFNMPEDKAYYYRAYAQTADDSILYANAILFGREAIDMGLPSGTKWSSVSIGASTPFSMGKYFAFAEPDAKTSFSTSNYAWYKSDTYLFPDGLRDVQATRYDAAAMNWADVWMLPDAADLKELVDNCTFTATFMEGMKIYQFKSKINNNCIYLAVDGKRNPGLSQYLEYGYMAGSTIQESASNGAYHIRNNERLSDWGRADGIPVRPVYKTNATSDTGKPMFVRTLAARKYYDGTVEKDTLRGVVRGLENAGGSAAYGFAYWKDGEERSDATTVTVTPDADGHVQTVIDGLDAGTTYHYVAYVHNGTTTYDGNELDVTTVGLVDLGLSVKWANVNLGAESEGASGDFYRWGAKVPYRKVDQQYTDNKDITPYSGYDIATNLWGSSYRMPTKEEFEELVANSTHEWTTRNGYKGYLFTSTKEGYTDRSVFFPAAGWYGDETHSNYSVYGDYWFSTVYNGDRAYRVQFSNGSIPVGDDVKGYGFPIRAVQMPFDMVQTSGMTRNTKADVEVISLSGFYTNVSGRSLTVGFVVGTSDDVDVSDAVYTLTAVSPVPGYYTCDVSGLSRGVTYYYRAYLYDGTAYQYGEARSFELIQMVDLGLPSGTRWANINVGANQPEGFGNYYAWGETEPKTREGKPYYGLDNYKWYQNGSYVDIGSDISGTEYDAATANMGQLWHLPTWANCQELVNNCTQTLETVNGVQCWRFTSKIEGYTDKSVLFPIAGRYTGNYSFDGSYGLYMPSTSVSASNCNDFYMPTSGPQATSNNNYKHFGMTVRAVSNVNADISENTVASITTQGTKLEFGATSATLRGNVSISSSVPVSYTYGFVIGSLQEVETTTPAIANVVTLANKDEEGNFSYTYTGYDGSSKFYRSFLKVGDTYYLGNIKSIGYADLLDAVFLSDGSAANGAASNMKVSKGGTITTSYNASYKRNEAILSGNTYGSSANNSAPNHYVFDYAGNTDYINSLADGHTLEMVMMMPESPANTGEANVLSNAYNGGSTIGCREKKIYSAFNCSGWKYIYSNVEPVGNMYYHAVTVYDKSQNKLLLYVDGSLNATLDVPASYSGASGVYQYCIGCEPYYNYGLGWNGTVVFARIYDDPLTAEQVRTLYDNLKK